jgi:RHS repeat-associated protein
MGTVRYTVVNGQVIAENRDGVRKTYVPDPSGSTIALLDDKQKITDTFSYSPFGELKSRTGTTPTPFQYIGTKGYYTDPNNRIYVRARTYQPNYARWMTVDPLWPGESAYGYARNNPVNLVDVSGLQTRRRRPPQPRPRPNCNGRDRNRPPQCSARETPVWITCFSGVGTGGTWGNCAVRCRPNQACCRRYFVPLCPIGTTIGIPGYGQCRVGTCGCGPTQDPPNPNNWIDVWFEDCGRHPFACWVCIRLPDSCTTGGAELLGPWPS